MEWAIAGGRLYVLQTRPMTALPPQPLRLNPYQRETFAFRDCFPRIFEIDTPRDLAEARDYFDRCASIS